MGFEPSLNKKQETGATNAPPIKKPEGAVGNPYVPTVTIDPKNLPSLGMPYPENSTISYRPFVFGEVKKISSSVGLTQKDIFCLLLEGIDTSFDKNLLTVNDVLYIGVLRKISTMGASKFSLEFSCPQCKQTNKSVLGSGDLDFEEMMAKKLPVVATVSGIKYKFTPLNVGDLISLIDADKHRDDVYVFSKQCRNMTTSQAYNAIYNCNSEDSIIFDKVDRYLSHKLKPVSAKCQNCESEIKISLDGGQAIMLPFRESTGLVGDGICFGDEDEC